MVKGGDQSYVTNIIIYSVRGKAWRGNVGKTGTPATFPDSAYNQNQKYRLNRINTFPSLILSLKKLFNLTCLPQR